MHIISLFFFSQGTKESQITTWYRQVDKIIWTVSVLTLGKTSHQSFRIEKTFFHLGYGMNISPITIYMKDFELSKWVIPNDSGITIRAQYRWIQSQTTTQCLVHFSLVDETLIFAWVDFICLSLDSSIWCTTKSGVFITLLSISWITCVLKFRLWLTVLSFGLWMLKSVKSRYNDRAPRIMKLYLFKW